MGFGAYAPISKINEIETRSGKSSFLALKCVVSMHGT
jgi:hypothetical protein